MGLQVKLPSAAEESGISLLACIADEATRETVSLLVAQLGWTQAKVYEGGIAMASQAIDPHNPPTLLVVDIADDADPMASLDELAEHCPPETKVIVIGGVNDIHLYRRLIAIGISDYLVRPVDPEHLRQAFLAAARPAEPPAAAAHAPAK